MTKTKIAKSETAARMKASRNQLDRVLNPAGHDVTIETRQLAAKAKGRSSG